MANINKLLRSMKEAAEKNGKSSISKTKGAVTRAISKKVVRDMVAKTEQEKKTKRRLTRAVDGAENPGDKELPDSLGGYDIWGATGIDGDGYAIEEQARVKEIRRLSKGDVNELFEAVQHAGYFYLKQGLSIHDTTKKLYDVLSESRELSFYEVGEVVVDLDMDLDHYGVRLQEQKERVAKEKSKRPCGNCKKRSGCSCKTYRNMMADMHAFVDRDKEDEENEYTSEGGDGGAGE
jgi:hypothetical protein